MAKRFDASAVELPAEINALAWIEWCEDRKERGKALTQRAAILSINKLRQFSHFEQAQAVSDSIMHGWTGLFPKRSGSWLDGHSDKSWSEGLL